MTISEKAAYVKGLAEGLDINETTKEGKLLLAIVDLLADITTDLEDAQDACAELCEQIDAVDEDLSELEDVIYDDDDEDECCGCDGCCDDDELYEVECPNCHDIIYVDDKMLEDESMTCPNCGTDLEFDLEDEDADASDVE